ncbi:MAG: DUF975 family protein [Lachnospiraceae bacterium]|nr:DUF975 family protein [Lachnospiraceae bacterium]
MWTRKELKERAKEALKRNYWKVLLVTVILIMIGGGTGSMFEFKFGPAHNENTEIMENGEKYATPEEKDAFISDMMDEIEDSLQAAEMELEQIDVAVWISVAVVLIIYVIILLAIVFAIDILLINPLYVGIQRFMLKSVDGTGSVSELGYTFDHNYKNGIKTAFFRDLHVFLWALLFIIPGIYKKYQYYMVDYILAENPDMPYQEVLERSKKMMDGHKWNTFVLDISFILWHMLSALTCGVLEVFYVIPYTQLTRASLYRKLRENEMALPGKEK